MESYSSAEMQSMSSAAPGDWAKFTDNKIKQKDRKKRQTLMRRNRCYSIFIIRRYEVDNININIYIYIYIYIDRCDKDI